MTIQLFDEEQDISLNEYSEDENYEDYAGIVLDKEKNLFKVITGKFKDKKDFYNKMADRGLILRKCFEIRVYNWIKENAKTTLDAYLMLSTAFSKWKGNNMLSEYYNKLLKDIPELNREGQKGNPNTRGKKEEAVLSEDTVISPEDIDELPYKLKVKYLFDDTTLDPKYINALAIEDPIESAINLIKAYNEGEPIDITSLPGGTYKNRNFYYDIEKRKQSDVINRINDRYKFDQNSMEKDIRDLKNNTDASYYDIDIYPVFGSILNNTKIRYLLHDKEKEVSWLKPETIFNGTINSRLLNKPLKDYGKVDSLKNELQNAEVRDAVVSEFENARDKYGNKIIGVLVKVFDNITKAEVTDLLLNSAKRKYNLVDVIGQDGQIAEKGVLPAGAGLVTLKDQNEGIKTGFFIDRNTINQWKSFLRDNGKHYRDIKSLSDWEKGRTVGGEFARVVNNLANELVSYEKAHPDDERVIKYNKQINFLDNKKTAITHASFSDTFDNKNPGTFKNEAIYILNDIETLVTNDYHNKISSSLSSRVDYSNFLKNTNSRAEFLDRANFTNISNVTQGAPTFDKLAAIRRGDDFDKTVSDKKKSSTVSKTKEEPKLEMSDEEKKEQKLLNAVKSAKSDFNYWNYMLKRGSEKDKREAEKQISKYKEELDTAQKEYDDYINSEEYLNFKNINKEEQTESFVNDGATSYYMDQQNAAKNALNGTFITEETTHSELNQKLFDGEILKVDVREALLEIADKFKQMLNINIDPIDVYFTGSNANYNYNENSDIDIHLVYDFERVGITAEILEKYLKNAKRLFNLDYSDITVKGIKVEVGYEITANPLVATGVYSLRFNKWIKKPENKSTEINDPDSEQYNTLVNNIETAIQDKDLEALEFLWKEIGKLRKQSLNLEGEFGQGNALFKKLRNLGTIGRLRDAYYRAASKDLSLESSEE